MTAAVNNKFTLDLMRDLNDRLENEFSLHGGSEVTVDNGATSERTAIRSAGMWNNKAAAGPLENTVSAYRQFNDVVDAKMAATAPDITVTSQATEQQRGVPVSQFGGFRNVVPTQAESRDDNAADNDKTATHQF